MREANGAVYGIAVRDDDGLWLLARIRRSRDGDVYYMEQSADPAVDFHVSYHNSGIRHLRSYGWKRFVSQLQRPDASFRGVETVFASGFPPGEARSSFRNLSTTMGHSWGLIRERFPVWRGMGWED